MLSTLDDPAALTAEARRREIASLLARGVLRLQAPREITPEATESDLTEETPQYAEIGLELCATTRPPVTRG